MPKQTQSMGFEVQCTLREIKYWLRENHINTFA